MGSGRPPRSHVGTSTEEGKRSEIRGISFLSIHHEILRFLES